MLKLEKFHNGVVSDMRSACLCFTFDRHKCLPTVSNAANPLQTVVICLLAPKTVFGRIKVLHTVSISVFGH